MLINVEVLLNDFGILIIIFRLNILLLEM